MPLGFWVSTPPSGTILSKRKCYRKKIVSIGPVLANGQGADGAIFGPDEENGMDRAWNYPKKLTKKKAAFRQPFGENCDGLGVRER